MILDKGHLPRIDQRRSPASGYSDANEVGVYVWICCEGRAKQKGEKIQRAFRDIIH